MFQAVGPAAPVYAPRLRCRSIRTSGMSFWQDYSEGAAPYFTAQMLAAANLLLKPSGSRKLTCTRSPAFSLDRS